MQILFLGASQLIATVALNLINNGNKVVVISNASQLNKSFLQDVSLMEYFNKISVKHFTIEKESDLSNYINFEYDIAISYGAPWILSSHTIENVFKNKILNIHGTHLPKYRGGTLFSWQILTGQRTGMCLIHQLTPQIDAGPIIAYKEFIYPASCRKPIDYIAVYEEKNIEFLIEFISNWNGWTTQCIQQPEYLSSYFPRLLATIHGYINWEWDNLELERFILAFDEPYGGARCKLNDKTVIIRDVFAQQTDGYFHPFQYGTIYRNNGKWLTVATKNGELLICGVFNENGENIISQIKVGDRFYTTADDINQTKQRVVKTKTGLNIKK